MFAFFRRAEFGGAVLTAGSEGMRINLKFVRRVPYCLAYRDQQQVANPAASTVANPASTQPIV